MGVIVKSICRARKSEFPFESPNEKCLRRDGRKKEGISITLYVIKNYIAEAITQLENDHVRRWGRGRTFSRSVCIWDLLNPRKKGLAHLAVTNVCSLLFVLNWNCSENSTRAEVLIISDQSEEKKLSHSFAKFRRMAALWESLKAQPLFETLWWEHNFPGVVLNVVCYWLG